MSTARKPTLGAVSAEYIFLDIVGYSKRLIEHQTSIIGVLNHIVLESVNVLHLAPDRVLYLPTGDGMCIALLNIGNPPDIQIQLALGILEDLHEYNSRTKETDLQFQVRIGINGGKDNLIIDINGNRNIAGRGINNAARIMDKADGAQILVGDRIVSDLIQHGKYASAFRPYTAQDKHGYAHALHQLIGKKYPFLNVDIPRAFQTPADIRDKGHLSSTKTLKTGGLKIRVQITATHDELEWNKRIGVEPKKSLVVMALVDTGAAVTVINPQVAVTCGLRLVGQSLISTTGQVLSVPEYAGAIHFPDSKLKSLDPVRFLACSLPGQDVSCLIGRDVLEKWRLVYDGRTGSVEIAE